MLRARSNSPRRSLRRGGASEGASVMLANHDVEYVAADHEGGGEHEAGDDGEDDG